MTDIYSTVQYVQALQPKQPTLWVQGLQARVVVRDIPGCDLQDAAGPYPSCQIQRPESRALLIDELDGNNLVSLVLVVDALQAQSDWYCQIFDYVRPYKKHYVVDTNSQSLAYSRHHRREVKKARKHCSFRRINLADYLDEWCQLYEILITRQQLSGVHLFSRQYFDVIASIPAFVAVAAFVGDEMVSCSIWLVDGPRVYNHLGASSERGYLLCAAYGVYDYAISIFSPGYLIDLGGAPDRTTTGSNLDFFKRGFANEQHTSWLVGAIVDDDKYRELIVAQCQVHSKRSYFPQYRAKCDIS